MSAQASRLLRLAALLLGLALVGSACAPAQAVGTDDYVAADTKFYRYFAPGEGGSEPLIYRSVAEMTKGSTVVTRARVVDVVPGRVIKEEGDGRLYMIGVVLEPAEQLHGRWTASYQGRLTVEFPSGSAPTDDEVAKLRDALPKGESVWFLRSGADSNRVFRQVMEGRGRKFSAAELEAMKAAEPFHALVASEGLLVQGARHVETPLRPVEPEEGVRPVRDEATRSTKLSQLSTFVRGI